MAGVASLVDLALFVVAFVWVGKRPTAAKTSVMVTIVALADMTVCVVFSATQGMDPYGYTLLLAGEIVDAYEGLVPAGYLESMREAGARVASLWVAIFVVGACVEVFCALILRWCVDRMRKKSAWAPFSQVDLPPTCVLVLVAGIVLYIVSMLPGVPHADMVGVFAGNVFVVSIVPLFVQGAAAAIGLMNKGRIEAAWQVAIGFLALFFGIAFFILPVLGLVDFWANVRGIEREDSPALRLEDST